jgi:phage terminase small subunit
MSGILKNARHEIFASMVAEGKTATEAALIAGYSERSARKQGSRLQTYADIVRRIEELQARMSEKTVATTALTRTYVLERLHENMKRALQAEPVYDNSGKPTGEYRYEGNVANRALELIGKEIGMFVEQKKIQLGRLSEATPEQLLQLLGEIDDEISRARKAEVTHVH